MLDLNAILKSIQNVKVIDDTIGYNDYFPIDLSTANQDFSEQKIDSSSSFEAYIEFFLLKNKAKVLYGGYSEKRNLYQRSDIFNDLETEERNIHIGLDLWIKAGTSVLAALDGKVHSFNFNTGLGNYGPTIILEHVIEGHIFFTLYGHLSIESIEEIEIGDVFKKGQKLATLGDADVNGDYAPHLHFQIIIDIQENFGDYPGVCSQNNFDYYLENCPDPNLLLKIS